MKSSHIFTLVALATASPLTAGISIETISLPDGIPPEVGGICFSPDGKLVVATRRSDIFKAIPSTDPKKFQWSLFASGFHNTCGVTAPTNDNVIITQMGEITEASDTDKDGSADRYNCLSSTIGLSGNYHETDTLYPDADGGYYIAAGTASLNGPTFWKTQGEYSKIGRRGRNYSSVQWRGWIMHYKDGKLTPFAKGFRQPNGIFQDSKKRLWATDNQGDFRATTPLYLIEKDNFYGHPSSLIWDEKFPKAKDPLHIPQAELDKMRTPATVLLPFIEMNRSAGQPSEIPDSFGIFPGQLIIPDNNNTRISRIMLDSVNGQLQGSCTHFFNDPKLKSGNHRLTWSPDGKQLYVGQTTRGWGKKAEGLQRLTYDGKKPFDITSINLTKTGLKLTTTFPISNLSEAKINVKSFHYQDSHQYGGKQLDKKAHAITNFTSPADTQITFDIENLTAGKVYHLNIENLKDSNGNKLANTNFYYTANQLPNN